MTLTCRGDCVHCIQRRQALADAVLALEIGGEPLTVARGEAPYADSIVAWSEVRQGDWAVYLGRLEQVGGAMDDPADAKRAAVLIGGSWRNPLREDLDGGAPHPARKDERLSKQRTIALLGDIGGELVEDGGPSNLKGAVIAPPGCVWTATGGHEIEFDFGRMDFRSLDAAWAVILGWVHAGVQDCTTEECGECAA